MNSNEVQNKSEEFKAGWDARNDNLNQMLFGDRAPLDSIELALKAYNRGYEEGAGDNDKVYNEFEEFAKFVRAVAGHDTQLGVAATNMLIVLEESKNS